MDISVWYGNKLLIQDFRHDASTFLTLSKDTQYIYYLSRCVTHMYESRKDAVLPRRQFAWRMAQHVGLAGLIIVAAVLVGMVGHMWLEPVSWHDAVLNVSLILAGIGPFLLPQTVAGKLFFAFYNVLVGVVILALIGVIMAPLIHRMLHKFHLDDED